MSPTGVSVTTGYPRAIHSPATSATWPRSTATTTKSGPKASAASAVSTASTPVSRFSFAAFASDRQRNSARNRSGQVFATRAKYSAR